MVPRVPGLASGVGTIARSESNVAPRAASKVVTPVPWNSRSVYWAPAPARSLTPIDPSFRVTRTTALPSGDLAKKRMSGPSKVGLLQSMPKLELHVPATFLSPLTVNWNVAGPLGTGAALAVTAGVAVAAGGELVGIAARDGGAVGAAVGLGLPEPQAAASTANRLRAMSRLPAPDPGRAT